jgi:hypothetical protein
VQSVDDFDAIVGTEQDFYGASENQFKLGDTVWEAVEDPDDGYRSYLGSIKVVDSKAIFFSQPLDRVKVSKVFATKSHNDFDGFELVGTDGHLWLAFGTEENSDYYPCFIFDYQPRKQSA